MPPQWRKVAYLAVGGLTEVGFAAGSLLLVVSHQGRGVVDLASGRQPLLISESEEMRAFGFSPDGTTFIIATSPGLAIYRRGDERQ
jgi:hypothetical protein